MANHRSNGRRWFRIPFLSILLVLAGNSPAIAQIPFDVRVDHDQARALLESLWNALDEEVPTETTDAPAADRVGLDDHLAAVLADNSITYKYILVTGLLAKAVNPAAHPRALQVSSRLPGAYDARSLCHKVLVPFEKSKGDLWGLSNEPFVNKPARHPEHRGSNPQLRDREGAVHVHTVLEAAKTLPTAEVRQLLKSCLRIGRQHMRTELQALPQTAQTTQTQRNVVRFVGEFLQEADSGARLTAVTAAFLRSLRARDAVRAYPTNQSDKASGHAGDVEITRAGQCVSAMECKHRELLATDVQHGIRKAQRHGLSDYWFVTASEIATAARSVAASYDMDSHLVNIHEVAAHWSALIGPKARSQFGATVVNILRDEMGDGETANKAAELWNQLTEQRTR